MSKATLFKIDDRLCPIILRSMTPTIENYF
jgi:hypothetical protein